MNRNNYPEMNKLIKLLAKNDIPFEVLSFPFRISIGMEPEYMDFGIQIFAPSFADHKIDAACHYGTYGYEDGLIEIMSEKQDDVVGWLTAEEAFEYFKEAVYG